PIRKFTHANCVAVAASSLLPSLSGGPMVAYAVVRIARPSATVKRMRLVLGILAASLLTTTTTVASSALACVVGTGTSASCTEAKLNACLPGGGSFSGNVTFNCGGGATITVTSTKTISADTTIDGGGVITISGGGTVGVFFVNSGVTFTVQDLTVANGNAGGSVPYVG